MKKRGFTLIEMVIVITILGLLMAFLIPKITEAQAKARDIKRQSDITMITTALVSYKHDHGEFPKITTPGINSTILIGVCISDLWEGYLSGYLTNIPQDPSGKGSDETRKGPKRNDAHGYVCLSGYGYIGSGQNFLLIYNVDDKKNGNYTKGMYDNNGVDISNVYEKFKNDTNGFKNILKQKTTGDYFVYIYE